MISYVRCGTVVCSAGPAENGARECGQVHDAALLHPVPRGHAGQPPEDCHVPRAHLRAGGRPPHRARRLLRSQDDIAYFRVRLSVLFYGFGIVRASLYIAPQSVSLGGVHGVGRERTMYFFCTPTTARAQTARFPTFSDWPPANLVALSAGMHARWQRTSRRELPSKRRHKRYRRP